MEVKNILITGVGGPTPRSFVKSIKDSSYSEEYKFIGVDSNNLAFGLYRKDLFDETYVVPPCGNNCYWEVINEIIRKENITAAVILPEVELLEWSRNSKQNLISPIKMLISSAQLIESLINKNTLYSILNDTNYVPKFLNIDVNNTKYDQIKTELSDTFWIRAPEGSSGLAAIKINSEHELQNWFSLHPDIKEYLASEFLPNRNIGCTLVYQNSKLISAATFQRVNYIMAKVVPSGITGNTSFGRFLNEKHIIEFCSEAIDFIAQKLQVEFNGPFTVDIKEDAQGNLKITEINVRYIAFISCIAKAGANIPLDHLQILFDEYSESNPKHYQFEEGLVFHREVDFEPILMLEKDLLIQNKISYEHKK